MMDKGFAVGPVLCGALRSLVQGGMLCTLFFSGVPRLPGLEFGGFPDSSDFPFEFKKS